MDTSPPDADMVSVTVSAATTALAVTVLVRTVLDAPEPTVRYTVETMGAAVVAGVWMAPVAETVLVRTLEELLALSEKEKKRRRRRMN